MNLILLSLAPVLIILFYIYFRDKYEKEPVGLLLKALLAGVLIVLPVVLIETFLTGFLTMEDGIFGAFWHAFIVAGFTEETFKFLALIIIIWRNPNFNEKFDGIVYSVFVSLGFAAVENILYVTGHGMQVGFTRAWTAVPAHAIFGIVMGYYFGIARMYEELKRKYLQRALLIPIFLHGVYDFILMSGIPILMLFFLPFLVYLYATGLKRMKVISDASVFKDINLNN